VNRPVTSRSTIVADATIACVDGRADDVEGSYENFRLAPGAILTALGPGFESHHAIRLFTPKEKLHVATISSWQV
jgi:hypothetical protein